MPDFSPKGRFAPMRYDNPGAGKICTLCGEPLCIGQVPTAMTEGPADDEERTKMEQGKAYNAFASLVHEKCAYPESLDPELERLYDIREEEAIIAQQRESDDWGLMPISRQIAAHLYLNPEHFLNVTTTGMPSEDIIVKCGYWDCDFEVIW